MACRICTTNDREALVEELAAEFWRDAVDARTWAEAGTYWQPIYRRFAERAVTLMETRR